MLAPSVCDWYGVSCSFSSSDSSTELSIALADPMNNVGNNFAGDFSAALACLTTSPGLPAGTFVVQLYVGNTPYVGDTALAGELPVFNATVFARLRQLALFGSGMTGTLTPFSSNPLLDTLAIFSNPGVVGPIPPFTANPLLEYVDLDANSHSGPLNFE